MKSEIVDQLHRLNQEFYQSFSGSFSSTRVHIQPGVRRILNELPQNGNFLDIGCGNGNLAVDWQKNGKKGFFLGLDFSSELLDIARASIDSLSKQNDQSIRFLSVDIIQPNWIEHLPEIQWDIVMMFAVLHHIPDSSRRKTLLRDIRGLILRGGSLFLSTWQIQNSPRLRKRIQPWLQVGLQDGNVEPGDVLMDWRAQNDPESGSPGLRYVHVFTAEELAQLAQETGFSVKNTFFSDGKEGNLAIYQEWI